MKFIKKAGEPHEYNAWRKRVKGTQDEHYQIGLKNPLKARLHKALIEEQGFICAYTMKRIDAKNSHIEHIKPESLCRADCVGSDLDYWNMLACFPREGMSGKFMYGAQARHDWWDNDGAGFVKPLDRKCEKRFRFDLEGEILSLKNDAPAKETIEKLGLAHPTLTEDRKRVVIEYVYGENGTDPLSPAKALQSIKNICDKDSNGMFHEFCVAIQHALAQHVCNLKKHAKKRKFARKKKS